MDRKHILSNLIRKLSVAALLTIICFPWLPTLAKQSASTPNIILIISDYMGYADIEPYGATDIKTPALATMAAKGVKFTNHYSSAPACIPSRASLMSGLYPSKVLQRQSLNNSIGLPSERNKLLIGLKSAGYATALVGKWHLGMDANYKPTDQGFDYFFGFNNWALGYHDHLTSDGEPGLYRNDDLVNEQGYLTHLFTDEATEFIEENATQPFFLYLSYNTGLPPYQGPNLPSSEWASGWDANNAKRSDYVAMVEAMDQGIGKVMSKLTELKLKENTLVIFTYDHGGRHLVDSGPLFHGFSTLWEGGIRVPLIIQWPRQESPNHIVSNPTIAMDLTATMLDVAQQGNNIEALDGLSLVAIGSSAKEHQTRPLFWRHGKMKAVRQGSWKYIVDGHTQLLFNLEIDIGERKNLFYQQPKKVKHLKQLLTDWELSLKKN